MTLLRVVVVIVGAILLLNGVARWINLLGLGLILLALPKLGKFQ